MEGLPFSLSPSLQCIVRREKRKRKIRSEGRKERAFRWPCKNSLFLRQTKPKLITFMVLSLSLLFVVRMHEKPVLVHACVYRRKGTVSELVFHPEIRLYLERTFGLVWLDGTPALLSERPSERHPSSFVACLKRHLGGSDRIFGFCAFLSESEAALVFSRFFCLLWHLQTL